MYTVGFRFWRACSMCFICGHKHTDLPAPKKTILWSRTFIPIMCVAAIHPASTTAAVLGFS